MQLGWGHLDFASPWSFLTCSTRLNQTSSLAGPNMLKSSGPKAFIQAHGASVRFDAVRAQDVGALDHSLFANRMRITPGGESATSLVLSPVEITIEI